MQIQVTPAFKKKENRSIVKVRSTVGQEIFVDMIFSRISRILTKPRKYHVSENNVNDLFAKKVQHIVNVQVQIRENIMSANWNFRQSAKISCPRKFPVLQYSNAFFYKINFIRTTSLDCRPNIRKHIAIGFQRPLTVYRSIGEGIKNN